MAKHRNKSNRPQGRHSKAEARRAGLVQRKALGQVFLHDDRPCQTLVRQLVQWGVRHVLEIGPGKGVLTKLLIEAGLTVTAVEKDERFAAYVRDHSGDWLNGAPAGAALAVHEGDFLEFDLNGWISDCKARDQGPCAVVGNIPYNISSPIVLKVLSPLTHLAGAIFLTQLEFAERIAADAGTKDYGSLTVLVRLFGAGKIIEEVSRELFTPVPKVDSALLTLTPHPTPPTPEEVRTIESVSRVAFHQRRKKLSNSIASLLRQGQTFDGCPIDLSRRPETLTVDEFRQLAHFIRGTSRP